MSELSRRAFLASSAVVVVSGCERGRRSETPLAHLYGKEWVHGAYAHYAKAYRDVESGAQQSTFDSYKLLAQKGVTALDALQAREVPFFIRVDEAGTAFRVEREVVERLTFDASMSEAERAERTRVWKLAREHLHTDYDEVRRLDWALERLLAQVGRVRFAIDEGRVEQFRLCRQLAALEGGGDVPFELPYQVTRAEYESVLLLLLGRIESDRERLRRTEAAIVSVGLVVRATDAGSASLSANTRKVLLAIVRDSEAEAEAPLAYPEKSDERDALLERARELRRQIAASAEFRSWEALQEEREDVIGQLLVVLDSMTGLPASGVYRQVMRVWRGGGDYLDYLKLAASIVPSGSGVGSTLNQAVETTERTREVLRRGRTAVDLLDASGGRAEVAGAALLNVGTRRARKQLDRQLAFFKDAAEADEVAEQLGSTLLSRSALPSAIPGR